MQAQVVYMTVMLAVLIHLSSAIGTLLCAAAATAVSGLHCRVQGGILSIDAAPGSENLIATAGADGVVVVFDRDAGRIRASLTGHTKKVNGELLRSSLRLICSCACASKRCAVYIFAPHPTAHLDSQRSAYDHCQAVKMPESSHS